MSVGDIFEYIFSEDFVAFTAGEKQWHLTAQTQITCW